MSKDLSARGEAVLNSSLSCTVKCYFFRQAPKMTIKESIPPNSQMLISILSFKFAPELPNVQYSKVAFKTNAPFQIFHLKL